MAMAAGRGHRSRRKCGPPLPRSIGALEWRHLREGRGRAGRKSEFWGPEACAGVMPGGGVPAAAWDMETLKAAVLHASAGTGKVEEAIKGCTFRPREQAFTTLIDLCGRMRDWKKAKEVFDAMKGMRSVRPNTYTYSALISACSSSGEWSQALGVFEEMKRAAKSDPSCKPNQVTFGALITACERGGMFDAALRLYEEMQACGISPDHATFTSVLGACEGSRQWQRAEGILDQMHSRGFTGPPSLYTELIANCAGWEKALELFLTMQAAGCDVDAHTCRALMASLEAGGMWAMAMDLLGSMQEADIPIDLETYNIALKALAKVGRCDEMLEVLGRIREATLEPDETTREWVEFACRVRRDSGRARQLRAQVGKLQPVA
ncbi:unnamed protein product [Ostreobium quekettii]|uniref:PROP1-like PPR domain-containing protein n=1 Tax=Ostreobium quekettii TaxID=121088 RepID=A0A8S1J372_9CHLO|nr:unnamed protein product [Ostreobium quekettii]|eukprot:evm.model.scf_263.7 EVM.evm.TU.scf_263.7   scf_263:61105-62627(+)